MRSNHVLTFSLTAFATLALGGAATRPALASALDTWFANATQFHSDIVGTKIAAPDVLPGKTKESACSDSTTGAAPLMGVWELLRYDRTHKIALAAAATDQCSVALFAGTLPAGVTVPDANLAHYRTKRGLGIGSTLRDVLATYGGHAKPMSGRRVLVYDAGVHDKAIALPHKDIVLPQRITIVLTDNEITSITIYTDEAGLF